MRAKHVRKAIECITPALGPNESVQIVGICAVGRISVAKRVAVTAATAVLTGGLVVATVHKKAKFCVLTTERLVMLEPSVWWGAPTSKIVGQIARAAIVGVSDERFGTWTNFDLTLAGEDKGLRLSFPTPSRTSAKQIQSELRSKLVINQAT